MAAIVWPSSKTKDATTRDPSLRAKIGPFITKLSTMSTSAGLHLEHIRGAADRRVRTARVTGSYRAVLFQIDTEGEPVYVIHGIWPHDEANRIAESITVGVNPYNGATEVTRIQDCVQQDARAVEQARRTARAELAAARREADELARETARIQAANVKTRRRNARARATEADGGAPVATRPRNVTASAVPGAVAAPRRDQVPTWPEGLTVETLRDELGIDVRLGAAALAAAHESQLLDLVATARVAWQGEALLCLATGGTIESVREDFELLHPLTPTSSRACAPAPLAPPSPGSRPTTTCAGRSRDSPSTNGRSSSTRSSAPSWTVAPTAPCASRAAPEPGRPSSPCTVPWPWPSATSQPVRRRRSC